MEPLSYDTPRPNSADEQHLNVLSILHYVWGGIIALMSCAGLMYSLLGLFMILAPSAITPPPGRNPAAGAPPPQIFGYFFTCFGTAMITIGWIYGLLNIYSGLCIRARKASVFSLVLAGFNCMSFPLGTGLGLFTFVMLSRESVKRMYADRADAHLPPPRN